MICFNPSYNNIIKTKIGKIFFHVIENHFHTHNKLSKIINKNAFKISYSCMNIMEKMMTKHNKKYPGKPIAATTTT